MKWIRVCEICHKEIHGRSHIVKYRGKMKHYCKKCVESMQRGNGVCSGCL